MAMLYRREKESCNITCTMGGPVNFVHKRGCHRSGIYHVTKTLPILVIVSLIVLLPSLPTSRAENTPRLFYPPFFNAAVGKPVTVTPYDVTCGTSGKVTDYCLSMIDEQSVQTCFQAKCSSSCQFEGLPLYVLAFGSPADEFTWGGCIEEANSSMRPPNATNSDMVLQFLGVGQPCGFRLKRSKINPPFILQSLPWNAVFSTWIYNDMGTKEGTIFDMQDGQESTLPILRLGLRGSQLHVRSGNSNYAPETWVIPQRVWTHLAIMIVSDVINVYTNGQPVYPAIYGAQLRSSRAVHSTQVGKSFTPYDPFIGYLHDFRIYETAVSNRAIYEIFTGRLPSTRIFTRCRCRPSHPALKEADPTLCVTNPGDLRPTDEHYRLDPNAHPPGFVNDDKEDTYWMSKPSITGEVTVAIDLNQVYEVRHVTVNFYSPYPDVVTIERRANGSLTWRTWQHYSQQCRTQTGIEDGASLTYEEDINCLPLIGPGEVLQYSRGTVRLDLLAGRPGRGPGDTLSTRLRAFLLAGQLRVKVRGHSFVTQTLHEYFGIMEIDVNATCVCNGHGSDCDVSSTPYRCTCASASQTTGRQCDTCAGGAFRKVTSDLYAADLCQECVCDPAGSATIYANTSCEFNGGQCPCKQNVEGRACELCKPGYYGLSASFSKGCQGCNCDTAGTVGGSNVCNVTSGQCPCKENVHGRRCDVCRAGYSNLQSANPLGCIGCSCDQTGTANDTCNLFTGQCTCKTYVTGKSCDTCHDGAYRLSANNADGCSLCGCSEAGAINATCHFVTGDCHCRLNVIGRKCDSCNAGFYAHNTTDMRRNGCARPCECSLEGSVGTTCDGGTGQCTCRSGVGGRACDRCTAGFYGVGTASDGGCSPCGCNLQGTLENSTVQCDAGTGQCSCREYVGGRMCDACRPGYYGLNYDLLAGCRNCSCDAAGTLPNTACHPKTGQCPCMVGKGDTFLGGKTCAPYMDRALDPAYGPQSGGTRIRAVTGFLGNITAMLLTIGNVTCTVDVINSLPMQLVCESGPLPAAQLPLLGTPQPLTMHLPPARAMPSPAVFTYLQDPVVTDVRPLRTILGGGLPLTVTGQYLNSVAYPLLEITMTHHPRIGPNTSAVFSSNCTHEGTSGSMMICPTPPIEIPSGVALARRRRRALWQMSPLITRWRRQTDGNNPDNGADAHLDKRINSAELQFYLGLKLDGVKVYRNLTNAMPHLGVFGVFRNPILHDFPEPERIKPFLLHWPIQETHIEILGEWLTYGARPKDYKVWVGEEECHMVGEGLGVTETLIMCVPPPEVPESPVSMRGHPVVVVTVGNLRSVVGFLEYRTSVWDYPPIRYGVIAAAIVILLIILIILVIYFCRRYQNKSHVDGKNNRRSFISAYGRKGNSFDSVKLTTKQVDLLSSLPPELKFSLKDVLLSPQRVVVGKSIGQGHFGKVHIGRLNALDGASSTPVAIKTLKESGVSREDTLQFLEEATLMKDFEHDNILGLLGVALDKTRVYVVLPHMHNGDLKTFITHEDNMFTVGELIHFAMQISCGMTYLSELHFVHRDLACRNCMIDKELVVKIGDFGLSRDIYEQDYYVVGEVKRPLPVKWMALESLERGVWSSQSDVWSFGILLWELLTRGCSPYPEVGSFDLKTHLLRGNRMDRPDYAPDEMYSLMLETWVEEPRKRPTFRNIMDRISYFLNESGTMTILKHKQGQQVPSVAFRGRSYLQLVN